MGIQFRYFILLVLINFSCNDVKNGYGNSVATNNESTDSFKNTIIDSSGAGKNISLSSTNNSVPEIGLPPVKARGTAARKSDENKSDIQIKTFRNENLNGYGYDIILNDHVYVHQPNVPALPGNKGFVSEKQAQKVAELVAYKIRHNILPPTLSVEELDSLGVK